MISSKRTPRLLGVAFLFQALASLVWTQMLGSLIVVGDISASMTNIASNAMQMRGSIVVTMFTVIGVAILGILLYVILRKQNEIVALVSMGLYFIEAIILAASRIPAFALLRVSQESVMAGHPDHLQTLGNLFYESAEFGDWLHMLPFALGAVLFYYLIFKSRIVPRALSLFGIAAASAALVGTVLGLLGYNIPILVLAPNFPFEIGIGLWLLVRGIPGNSLGSLGRDLR